MSKISIYVSNHRAYVWSVQDVADLRAKHRVCGTLTGTLPQLAQQNFFLGLPLLLMPEEVVLLVENQVAVLVDDSKAIREPSPTELAEWDDGRKRDITRQIDLWHNRERARLALDAAGGKGKGKMSEEAIRKRKEREERRTRNATVRAAADGELDPPSLATPEAQPELPTNVQAQPNYTVNILSASQSHSWYQPSSYVDLLSAADAGIWSYPRTPEERASCRVFRDLWEKGHFLGSGIKFGGDYLVYPGDPLRYHSHFAASVLSSTTAVLKPMEIVAHGRLGTATKKAHLLCGWDETKQDVTYFSIEWAGFG